MLIKTNSFFSFLILFFLINIKSCLGLRPGDQWESYSEDGLPPLFEMEDFFQCEKLDGDFCKTEIIITPNDGNSSLATEIKKSQEAHYRFFRSSIYRMLCISKENTDIKKYIAKKIENELWRYNVTINVPSYVCNVNRHFNVNDYFLCGIMVAFVCILYKSTVYDIKKRNNCEYPLSKYDKWFQIFSIRQNWNKIKAKNTNPDHNKLKSIQGIRFLNAILIVAFHTKIVFGYLYWSNPKDLEQIFSNQLMHLSLQTDMHLVQIYFMISTFLLTNHIYEIHKEHGHFSLPHCFKLYINRIVRFLPTVGIFILFFFPLAKSLPQGTVGMDFVNQVWNGNVNSWWATLLQINYILKFSAMSLPGTWYLSVDTLMYISTIAVLYIQLRYKLDLKKVLAIMFIGTTLGFAYTIYFDNLDIMYRMNIQSMGRMLEHSDFEKLYTSPLANLNTSCVGIAMGAIYYHTKNRKNQINPILQIFWLPTIILLPILTVYASTYTYVGINKAIIGSLLKPTFALGFGIAILGMSNGLGGILKKILESNFFVTMSNFTYCTYLSQFPLVFSRGLFTRSPIYFQSLLIVKHLLQDITISFIFGILITITIEYPGYTLQKMYIPQIVKLETKISRAKEKESCVKQE